MSKKTLEGTKRKALKKNPVFELDQNQKMGKKY